METMDEILMESLTAEEYGQTEEDLLQEAWPIPPEDYTREFENYLSEIGVRF